MATPEDQVDYAEAKLAIDRLIDPSIDVDAVTRMIAEMIYDIRQMAGSTADDERLLGALRAYLYRPGPWNAQRIFGYDHDDPLGTNVRNKLIPTYLASRKGNCVSMPALFVILSQRLGLEMTLSTAPDHVFVHYHDPSGTVQNLEPTSGGNPFDNDWIRTKMPMTDHALETGVYLKVHSKRESVAILAETLLVDALEKRQFDQVHLMTGLVLSVKPIDPVSILMSGKAYAMMIEDFRRQYPNPRMAMPQEIARYRFYQAQNRRAFDVAFAMGWRPEEGVVLDPSAAE